jgi:hypothetical protein
MRKLLAGKIIHFMKGCAMLHLGVVCDESPPQAIRAKDKAEARGKEAHDALHSSNL